MAVSLDLLRTFLAVYREGSLTHAAQRLSLSQPAVTAQLRALEAAVGRPLFNRLPRGVAPTPMADLLARRVADPLDQLGALLVTELDDEPRPLAGIVHLAGPAEFVTAHVLPALAGLVGRGLELRITLGVADLLLRSLRSGEVDLAVMTTRVRLRDIQSDPLYDEEFALVAGAALATRLTGAPDLLAALASAPLITYGEELPIVRRYWQTVFGVRPVRHAAVVVGDLRAVRAAVVAGAGFSVLPTYLCADDVAAGRLVILHHPPMTPLNTLYLARRMGTSTGAAVAAVRDHLLGHPFIPQAQYG